MNGEMRMTERLILRSWLESDAEAMFEQAKNPNIGPIAGWPPHDTVEDSLDVIRYRFSNKPVYAVCLKENNIPIGCVGFIPAEHPGVDANEIEVGYWLGESFWGRGIIPEAVEEMLSMAFTELGYETVWCSYYEGNTKSKRCSEKCGFVYHHTEENIPCEQMGDIRTLHCSKLTKESWIKRRKVG